MDPTDRLDAVEDMQDYLDSARWRMATWGLAIAIGNGALMALLSSKPFPDAAAQVSAGAAAIIMHGWAAWALGSGIWRLAKSSAAVSSEAASICVAMAKQRQLSARQGAPAI